MPELPEIAVLTRQMQAELVGRAFSDVEVLQPKCLNVPPEEFRAALSGAEIRAVTPRGKWVRVEARWDDAACGEAEARPGACVANEEPALVPRPRPDRGRAVLYVVLPGPPPSWPFPPAVCSREARSAQDYSPALRERKSRPSLITWTEWLQAKGLRLEDIRPQRQQRRASASTGQMRMALGRYCAVGCT